MRLKTKLSLGVGFLFIVMLTFGILSIFYIHRLSQDAQNILKYNYESLVYSNNMLKSLEDIPNNKLAAQQFLLNLKKQQHNITEPGEKEATDEVYDSFLELSKHPSNLSLYQDIRQSIQTIVDVNQQAILRKNAVAQKTAEDVTLWLSIIFTLLILICFTLTVNLPEVIAHPIKVLSEGINAIAAKDYNRRIHLKQEDEFGSLANAFNTMAEKLEHYEHSNLAKIQFEKSRIETIINQMKEGIIGLDEKKNLLFVNAVAQSLLDLKEEEIIGKYAADIALKNDLMRTLLQPSQQETPLKIYANKKESYFKKENYFVQSDNDPIGEVIVLTNITLFHELDSAKTNFIATVSHELKTPIASLLMSLKLLQDERIGIINNEQAQLLSNINDDASRLLKITGELLKIAQVEAGKIDLTLVAISPEDILNSTISANLAFAQRKQIKFDTQFNSKLPLVLADVEKIQWVLNNLITNAIRYSLANTIITISAHPQNETVVFSVQDSGKGIPPSYLDKIFDRYFRIPGSLEEGTGLGLAICKEFIEAHGGKISVNSTEGVGSTFYFSLRQSV